MREYINPARCNLPESIDRSFGYLISNGINSLAVGIVILGLIFAFGLGNYSNKKSSEIIYLTAKSAIVIDARTNRILYVKNKDLTLPPASCVKLMTAVVALEKINLNAAITISKKASEIEPSKVYLRKGVRYKAGDLLSACLISSSNDAAFALAEGAIEKDAFIDLMNRKAKQIGMKNTHFANSTGLPIRRKGPLSEKIEQYSTVYDLTLLMRYCLSKPEIVELLSTKEKFIQGSDDRKIRLINHNKMLFTKSALIIGKTGYTIRAGHCFVGATALGAKDIIFAILSSSEPWKDLSILVNYGLYSLDGLYLG